MKEFMKNHPELEDTCDIVLSLLPGSFALLAVGFVWAKELIGRKKAGKDGGGEACKFSFSTAARRKRKATPCTSPARFWTA